MSEGPAPSKTTSIILVDDDQLLTDALTVVLHREPDLRVVDVAGTCAAALASLSRTCPDVLVLDVSLPDGDGLSLVPEFNRLCPGTYILVLTAFSEHETLVRAIETGVNGLVSKVRPLSEVITAIRRAARGEA
jgi:DNA-binding NarL/FixJ family response regulator